MAIDKMALLLKSQELRQHFGEDINSPTDIFALVTTIEKLTLVKYPMSDNLSGMCIKADGSRVIAINSKMSLGRQRFSLAHELYHLYYDENMTAICSATMNTGSETELICRYVCSVFPYAPIFIKSKVASMRKDEDPHIGTWRM
ncbi:MAG: ImmA/IrrE family metallo-endopeptidase [Angelakisella sp.]